ncbi:MAG: TIGR02757 family protein [Bacteroidetes bacterium]|nr:TIGR02757 family protein [Bacteroidota bacterium]
MFQFLEEKYDLYNRPSFIDTDPISVPHQFEKKEDIEISAFLTATLTWGIRKSTINSANKLMQLMDFQPYEFIINAGKADTNHLKPFVHRTFNGNDCIYFIHSLENIYCHHGGLEKAFSDGLTKDDNNVKNAIIHFRKVFLELPHHAHVEKHISDPQKNASAKRILMFLRWMVRNDKRGVDFGIWHTISPSQLYCPLDVHTGNIARKLGLLNRTSNDWKAAEELTRTLRQFDSNDPVKYDYALFGLGIFEKF